MARLQNKWGCFDNLIGCKCDCRWLISSFSLTVSMAQSSARTLGCSQLAQSPFRSPTRDSWTQRESLVTKKPFCSHVILGQPIIAESQRQKSHRDDSFATLTAPKTITASLASPNWSQHSRQLANAVWQANCLGEQLVVVRWPPITGAADADVFEPRTLAPA